MNFNTSGMQLNFLTLSFRDGPGDEPGQLENEYWENHYLKYLNQSRGILFLAIIFSPLMRPFDFSGFCKFHSW